MGQRARWAVEQLLRVMMQSERDPFLAFQQAFHCVLSAGTVSAIVAEVHAQIHACHSPALHREGHRYVFLDAKHGCTCHRRPRCSRGKKKKGTLLQAWGLRHSGREELTDFGGVDRRDEENWVGFMTHLERRGLKSQDRLCRPLPGALRVV